ncbi:heterokaryon incompatibility protein-domain-containing protein [Colletotrichum lupini]|nr:heterokaryon incompatibility protein-domain-containing protein [Colletotrichum lupini]
MDENTRYTYKRLRDDQIRLIRFLADESTTAIDLSIFSINQSLPAYQSLSYSWMTDGLASDHALMIGDRKLPILGSVYSFTQALRSKGILLDGTWWWIDSICIDQRNLEERNQQVRLMQEIYRRARRAIVWLGEKSHDSNEAIKFIRLLNKVNLQGHSDTGIRPILEQYRNHYTYWTALKSFFLRKWWTRIWTIQEFVIPERVSMWCGTQSINRTVICRALWTADKCPWSGFKETLGFSYGFNRRRLWMLYKISKKSNKDITMSLPALAAYFSQCDATDDRDRLYGLRALSTDGFLLEVSYARSVEEVYLHYTQAFIDHHKSLDIICFASVYSSSFSNGYSSMSWVPDWRLEMHSLVTPLMASQGSRTHIGNMRPPLSLEYSGVPAVYSASRDREAEYSFHERTLTTKGTLLDTIDGLAGSRKFPFIQSSHQNNLRSSTKNSVGFSRPIEILRRICKTLVLDRKNRYLQYAMPDEDFFHDFIRLCSLRMEDSPDLIAQEFQEWFDWTRPLLICGHTFESIVRDTLNNDPEFISMAGPPPNQAEFIHDSFFGRLVDTIGRMSSRLMVSCDGHVGLVPQRAMKGDFLCVLFGCSVPVVLRRYDDTDSFVVIGECFVDGYMEGAGAEPGLASERTFLLT